MAEITIYEKGTSTTDTSVFNKVDKINNSDVDFAYVNVSPSFNLQMKDEVSLLDINNVKIFGGYVRSISNKLLKECIVFGYDVLLSDIEIQKNFENYSPEGIIQYCVEEAGLTYNSTIVSGLTIPLYPVKDKKLKTIIDDMLNILGAVSRIDVNKNAYLEYPGETTNPITLEIGKNCTLDKGWDWDSDNLCTQVKVKGDIESIQTEQFFDGTGSQTEFLLSNIFVSVKVEYPVGTELTPEISGVQSGDYTISKETKKITFNSAPASGTDNIKITYSYDREITYTEASEIILSDKSNLHQKTIKKDYLKTIEDVEAYAGDYLDKFSKPLINGTILYNTLNINQFTINQSINVIDNTRKVNGKFINKVMIIKRLLREFGNEGSSLLIEVGESTDFSFSLRAEQEVRLKQLEENITTAELLQFGIKTTDNLTIQFDSDIPEIEKRTFDSDTFYWQLDNPTARNQWKTDGTGSVWKEEGYTSQSVIEGVIRLVEDDIEERVTEGGTLRVTEEILETTADIGAVTSYIMNISRTNTLNNLLTKITHIAVGDDNTTPTESDLTLGNQTYIEAISSINKNSLKLTSKAVLDITENNGNTVYELGGFNSASGGDMIFRNLTTVVPKDGNTEIRLSNILTINTLNTNL